MQVANPSELLLFQRKAKKEDKADKKKEARALRTPSTIRTRTRRADTGRGRSSEWLRLSSPAAAASHTTARRAVASP